MEDAPSPKFGNWDSDAIVPYTEYFEQVAMVRGERKSDNSYHADENRDATSKDEAPAHPLPLPLPSRSGFDIEAPNTEVPKLKDESQTGGDDGDTQKKMQKTNGVADRSAEYSPLHPHYQVKSAGKAGISSPWERRGLAEGSHGISPNTPGRSKLRVVGRGDDTPEKSSALPRFGEWDENNPSSADGYSDIFNKVREEKQGGTAKVPIYSDDSQFHYGDKRGKSTICWCFSWAKK